MTDDDNSIMPKSDVVYPPVKPGAMEMMTDNTWREPDERWTKMWDRQQEQQEGFNLNPEAMSDIDKARTAKDLFLGLYEEVGELTRVTARFKAHILKSSPPERLNIADEAADALKYLISICQLYGVSSQDLFEAFNRKSDVVADRARGERLELERHTRLIICDLDNVIADLSGWQDKLNTARGDAPMNDRTVQLLESLKEDFYRDGGFKDLPAIKGAPEGTHELRRLGFKIVLITARPYWQYKRLYGDTLQWLQAHNVAYDLILFNKDKAEAIYEHIFPAQPLFFVEDAEKHAISVAAIGVPVLLLDWDYNRDIRPHPLIKRMEGWGSIIEHVRGVAA